VHPCPFQKRFKQVRTSAFFRAALERLATSVVSKTALALSRHLAQFDDVRIYDGTGASATARPSGFACLQRRDSRSKWIVGYRSLQIKTGLLRTPKEALKDSLRNTAR
jgi:hypothetical protein